MVRFGDIMSAPNSRVDLKLRTSAPIRDKSRNSTLGFGGSGGNPYPSEVQDVRAVEYINREDPFSLDTAVPSDDLHSLSRLAWVQCSPFMWVLECFRKGFMKVEETKDLLSHRSISTFSVHYFPSDVKERTDEKARDSPKHSTHLSTAPTLGAAVRTADRHVAEEVFPGKSIRP